MTYAAQTSLADYFPGQYTLQPGWWDGGRFICPVSERRGGKLYATGWRYDLTSSSNTAFKQAQATLAAAAQSDLWAAHKSDDRLSLFPERI